MTTKHTAKTARDNLYFAHRRAATAMSSAQKRTYEARQRVLQDKARMARELSKSSAASAPSGEVSAEVPEAHPAPDAAQ